MDKFTIRGLAFSGISMLGLGYEMLFVQPPRIFILVMYGIVVGIGLLCIFRLKEE